MLTELHIENLGVIERVEVILGPGLTVVTGETGAGKTMIIEAIELLVGGRADTTVVRHGTDEARIDGRFVTGDGEELVLTRVVARNGRSRAYLNGRVATVTTLAEATTGLVDLHGQHAHQSLLSTATQRIALDRFGGVDLAPLRAARARLTEIDAELATLGGDQRGRAREIDLLRYQLDELDRADVTDPAEDERLDAEESLLGDAVAHRESAEQAVGALADDGGARDSLAAALGALGGRVPYTATVERLHILLSELDDIAADVRQTAESIDESPERLEAIRERRQLLKNLCRKYGDDLTAVMAFHVETRARLDELELFDERAAALDHQRLQAIETERSAAQKVGAARRSTAPELAAAVQTALRELALPHAEVAIQVGDHDHDDPGDHVTFLLAANPGSPLLPLTRVASGGELARTMLALRLTLTGDIGPTLTLVFDEVDAGIGGNAATAVARALARLGTQAQVMVVTHLAQVAAVATAHYVVDKSVRAGVTTVSANEVTGEQRVTEIARMLSGTDSASARQHAQELLT